MGVVRKEFDLRLGESLPSMGSNPGPQRLASVAGGVVSRERLGRITWYEVRVARRASMKITLIGTGTRVLRDHAAAAAGVELPGRLEVHKLDGTRIL